MSTKTLWGLAGIAIVTTAATGTMKYLLEKKIEATEICQKSLNIMHLHEPCTDALGLPVKVIRPSVLNKFTKISHKEMNIAVRVKGSESRGVILISAFRENTSDNWQLNFIRLRRNGKEDLIIT